MNGFVNVLKPPGMSSHQVVAQLRRWLGRAKVGHLGTLDPGAAGVLPLAVDKATRLIAYAQDTGKTYRAEMTLGITTDTLDAEGQVLDCNPPGRIERAQVNEAIARFTGKIQQYPPMYSAVHHQGKRLYQLAREGVEVSRELRWVEITRLELINAWLDERFPRLLLDISCSSGTYIRSLCADLGAHLGCGAYMSFLVRTRSGQFGIDSSWTLEELQEQIKLDTRAVFCPMDLVVQHLPRVVVRPTGIEWLRHGRSLPTSYLEWEPDGVLTDACWVRLTNCHGELEALGQIQRDTDDWRVNVKRVLTID